MVMLFFVIVLMSALCKLMPWLLLLVPPAFTMLFVIVLVSALCKLMP